MNETVAALLSASLVLGACGGSVDLVSPDDSGGTAGAGGAGAGGRGPSGSGGDAASGGSGSSGAPSVGGSGGQSGAGGVGGAGAAAGVGGGAGVGGAGGIVNVPNVDPDVSARYRWEECGRISPTAARPWDALYAADGSILTADERRGILAYRASSASAVPLVSPDGAEATFFTVAMELSSDGTRLLRQHGTGVDVYVAEDGGTIDAGSGPLVELSYVDLSATTCPDDVRFSADAELIVAHGPSSVCVWDASSGVARATIDLSVMDSARGVLAAGAATGPTPVRVLHDQRLLTLTASGDFAESFDLGTLLPAQRVGMPALSPDGATLLAAVAPAATDATWHLVAIDTESGLERWRQAAVGDLSYAPMTFSDDGYVLVGGEGVFQIENGSAIRSDSSSFLRRSSALARGGGKKLVVGELIEQWDLATGTLMTLYGTHTRRVAALDVSRDGRYFASHGDWAVLWELAPEFGASRPLIQGRAPDSSWNVAITADGSGMIVSGDNVGFFRRDGSSAAPGAPPSAPIGCLSPDWSFSPSGGLVAGGRYGSAVEVWDTRDFSLTRTLPATNCGGGITFSPDGSSLVTASLELFETKTWTKVWAHPSPERVSLLGEHGVEFSPDGQYILVTSCADGVFQPCQTRRYASVDGAYLAALPGIQGDRARYSPEGHWVVSRERALHLPSEAWFDYATGVTAAAFVPNGDIIAGNLDGSLVRFCRSDG